MSSLDYVRRLAATDPTRADQIVQVEMPDVTHYGIDGVGLLLGVTAAGLGRVRWFAGTRQCTSLIPLVELEEAPR